MSKATRQPKQPARRTGDGLTEYLAALEEIYPAAKGEARVITRPDKRVIVSILLPTRVRERMRLFDRMAEVGTRLLLETGQYVILSGR
jgi:hypothetical protein